MPFTIFYHVVVAKKYQDFDSSRRLRSRNASSFQNTNKISSQSAFPDLKLCPFDPAYKTNSQYICYQYEKCCKQGCCSNYRIANYASWYFWLIIAIILLIFYLGSWYCKKVEIGTKRTLRMSRSNNRSTPCSSTTTPSHSPRRRPSTGNVDRLLDCLIQTYRLQNINEIRPNSREGYVEPPPKYVDALGMPKLIRSNVQIVQIHANDQDNPSAQSNSLEGSNEVPPTYEDAVHESKESEDKNTQ